MNNKIARLLKNEAGNYIFPFFWQHGEPEEVLRRYMEVIEKSNIKAVCVESRPHPDFCGEGWWRDMDVILDEARKRGMKVWILDDSHFPTGFANGAMANQPDERCRQSVCCRVYDLTGKDSIHIGKEELLHPDEFERTQVECFAMPQKQRHFDDDKLLAFYAVRQDSEENGFVNEENRIDLRVFLNEDGVDWEIPDGNWKIYVLHLSRNHGYHRDYINMMDRSSCRILLDAVYEPHYAHYKEDFGTTIAGFFSDEPELGNGHMYAYQDAFGSPNDYPWSQELEEKLKTRLGKDYGIMLALLWETQADADMTAKVRYTYMDAVTELVRDDFSRQIGDWCRDHDVKYIGHLIEDDNHHSRTGSSLGHYFRGLAGQDMAGIDDIGGQVFPQGEDVHYDQGEFRHRNGTFYHYMLGKLGSSAAAIEPLKNGDTMCEIFGAYGWEEGVRLEKYLADHFMVRGVNHFVPHAFSAKEYPDPDCPPHFFAQGNNPQYRHFGCLMAYMNRVCELISGGRHIAPVAILYHAEGDWTGKYMTADKIGHVLADSQIEYDFIPQEVFADRESYRTEIKKALLKVNTQEYRLLLVPYMQYVTKAFTEAVAELRKANIPVLFVGGHPEGICDTPVEKDMQDRRLIDTLKENSDVAEIEDLGIILQEKKVAEITLVPKNDRIRYFHYVHKDGTEVYFFVNEGTETYKGNVQIGNKSTTQAKLVYLYDAWDNCIEPAEVKDGMLVLEIEPLKSRLFVFDATASTKEVQTIGKKKIYHAGEKETVEFSGAWKRSICRSLDYPAFIREKEICIPDNLAEEEPEFSGFVRYENTFTAHRCEKLYLEISDAYEGVEVFLNGVSLGIQIVPLFRFDLSDALKSGENKICIEVATTLEREMARVPNQLGEIVKANSFSGITGEIKLWKVKSQE